MSIEESPFISLEKVKALVSLNQLSLMGLQQPVNLLMLRLDLMDEVISGNKWFKLKLNLEQAKAQNKTKIITFGGAYSNHIAATAMACKLFNLESVGIIRGEEIENHTLQQAKANGMQLHFVSRELYRNKEALMQWVSNLYNDEKAYIVPEGGANQLGADGCVEINELIHIPFDYITLACGTGTTLAGITKALKGNQQAIGFSALKGGDFLHHEIQQFLPEYLHQKYSLQTDYHFGGYAKHNKVLLDFMQTFEQEQGVQLDFIYNAKMMFGVLDLISKNYFAENSTIVAVHTGGLQGNLSLDLNYTGSN